MITTCKSRKFSVWAPLLLVLVVGLSACSKPDKQSGPTPGGPQGGPPPALPVTALPMKPADVATSVEAVGETEGSREVEVRARVGGILLKRLYNEGASVKSGQTLFQIDRAPFEITLAHARAQLAEQKARVEQAKRETERLKGLLAQQAVSQREYDDSVSGVALSEAGLLAAQARVREAELNLSYTSVTAPVSGISGRAFRSEGTLVSTGPDSLLTTLVQIQPLWVRFSLGDSEMARLPGGRLTPGVVKGVELILPDGSVYPTKGRLNFAASEIDPRLGTLQFRAEFDNPKGELLPGQFVRARVLTGVQKGVFLVPQSAVMQSENGRAVFVVGANNTVEPRPVTTGDWHGTDWVILGGLKEGDRVIVDNLMKLRPGAPVMPHAPGEKPDGPPAAQQGGSPAAPQAAKAR
ncbi:MAG: efflux RND transporter periplasmic adaptor subunit [Nitrospirota bacterium]|nr:efflux RND transporter periplasmic adaptor subunit [Nitrospirota bacterium]